MIATGTRFGPYEILGLLGAGGMGEVYRARDTRLDRNVAIKVLPAAFASDADRLRRFEQEARATGALNHPNIIAIYDVGRHDDAPYEVTELLEGETLRTRLAEGPIPPRRAVDFAVQIARGLAAAHAKGIIHRDLKPENVFVTRDGLVKILDFGLAKLFSPTSGPGADPEVDTRSAGTDAGTVLGTVGYMSPEQVRGRPCDHRTDIFTLGVILHEMLSRRHPFRRESSAETMAAILREDAAPLSDPGSVVAPPLGRIVNHCLEKTAEQRFQSASDVAFALEALSGASGTASIDAAAAGGPEAGAVRTVPAPPRFHQLTFRRGHVMSARFAPDGNTIVYSALWDGNPLEIFSTWPENPESRSLGFAGSELHAISSAGELALSLRRHIQAPFHRFGTLGRVPLAGGAAREIAEGIYCADWSPDGRSLAVARMAEGRIRLEFPIGKVVHETTGAISHLRISPGGNALAFNHHPARGDSGGSVVMVDLSGKARILSDGWSSATGLAWSPQGDEIWFTATRTGHDRHLRAVSLSGELRVLYAAPGWLTLHDVSRAGRALVTHETNRRGIIGRAMGAEEERDLSWHDWSYCHHLSNDGRTVLFSEQRAGGGEDYSVYIRDTDGSPAVRLGDGWGLGLSPDGRWALAVTVGSARRLMLLPTGVGEPRDLTSAPLHGDRWAAWHPDGRRVFFLASETGSDPGVHQVDIESGETCLFVPAGPVRLLHRVSPDGRYLLVTDRDRQKLLYAVEGGEPIPVPALDPQDQFASWSADSRSVYAFRGGQVPTTVFRVDLTTGRREVWRDVIPADTTGVLSIGPMCMTPDGSAYVYSFVRFLSDLFLVEGLT